MIFTIRVRLEKLDCWQKGSVETRRDNSIVRLSFEFALKIVSYCAQLEDLRKYELAKQLLKAGTSIGANVREAQHSESRADFIHKMKIASKEAAEAEYWLSLIRLSGVHKGNEELETNCREITRILSSIISTAKRNLSEGK